MNRILNLFRIPPAVEIAKLAIAQYERDLIDAEATAAYNKKMTEYYREGIARLRQQWPQLVAPN